MRSGALVCILILGGLATGCSPKPPAASGPAGLFEQHCARCHAQAGEPGGPKVGGSRGPNLTKIGAEPGRDATYIASVIRDPKSKIPDAKMMESFAGVLS